MSTTIIGDVHGKFSVYQAIAKQYNYTLQLGDMGFDYSSIELDPEHHKFFGGNHDNYSYEEIKEGKNSGLSLDFQSNGRWYRFNKFPANCVGQYGLWRDIFFVRGAWSIDYRYRTIDVDLFEFEEMADNQLYSCIDEYAKVKPSVVVSHTCPNFLIELLHLPFTGGKVFTTKTSVALAEMYYIHQPDLWIFGHFHQSVNIPMAKTRFICLNELETYTCT